MMTPIDGILLGAIQGLTEFLPVSSSGHLILMRELLGLDLEGGLAFDAVLQLGTILAVLIYFRVIVIDLIRDTSRIVIRRDKTVTHENRQLIVALIIGTIPAMILGLTLQDIMDTAFRNPLLVAAALIAGSLMFWFAERLARQKAETPGLRQGLIIGCFQALALVPGVSRSGATISGGLITGLKREAAARFGFLLSLPIITGSGLKMLIDIMRQGGGQTSFVPLILGFIVSFALGLACISFLMNYLKRHTLTIFIWYRLALAVVVIAAMTFRTA